MSQVKIHFLYGYFWILFYHNIYMSNNKDENIFFKATSSHLNFNELNVDIDDEKNIFNLKSNNNSNIFTNGTNKQNTTNNTILNDNINEKSEEVPIGNINLKRLNSYDNLILDAAFFIKLDDESLNIDERILRLEIFLENINEKIKIANQTKNQNQIQFLYDEQKQVLAKLEVLKESQKSQNIISKININEYKFFNNLKSYFSKFHFIIKIIYKLFKPFYFKSNFKKTLMKLNNINENVSELIKLKVPYGEEEQRYETLVYNLTKAGVLHSQISKEINT